MRRLTLYILRQIIGPFALFTLLLTLVVWLTQSLRLLDLVINRGQSAPIFAYLTLLMLPSLLTVIVPVAFFGAALYALHKLNNDSEMVVMWSAGVSRLQLAIPVVIAATVAMSITYACGLWLMPAGQRAMRDKVFDIRADIGAAILREGAFTQPTNGLTVFIRELRPAGEIRGILVHDNRNPKRPISYVAEAGMLAQTPEGARLIMINGNVQQSDQAGARLSVLRFDRYVFDLDQFAGPQRATERETSERYLSELFFPEVTGAGREVRQAVYRAEGHNRLSSPLYCLAFALIALAATASGQMARGSYAMRLTAAAVGGAILRMLGYGAQGAAARNPSLSFLLYLLPLSGIAVASAILAQLPLVPESIRRLFVRRAAEAAP
jgi:lipopolysaccharide export system permease protein